MKASVRQKLAQTQDRLAELDRALADEDIARDPARLQTLSRERAEIEPVASGFAAFCAAEVALRRWITQAQLWVFILLSRKVFKDLLFLLSS